jgi:acyl dehydratase
VEGQGGMTKYFDDFAIGETMQRGSYEVTREEAVDFSARYSRPFDDPDAIEQLRLTGAHSFAIFQRLQTQMSIAAGAGPAIMAGIAADEVRWLTPVHSGDVMAAEMVVIEKIESRSKPDRGVVKFRCTLSNQDDQVALAFIYSVMMKRRPD